MIGGGETPKSAARAGRLGLGVLLAILCGHRKDISILSAYTMNRKKARHSPERLKIGFMGHVYLAEITEQAIDEFYPLITLVIDTMSINSENLAVECL